METELNWLALPDRFNYIRNQVEEYRRWLVQHKHKDRIAMAALSPAQIGRLAEVYDEIDSRNDAGPLSIWMETFSNATDVRDSSCVYWPIMNLFCVFEHLRKRNVHPFNSGRVRYNVPNPIFDWTKLPEELRYLGEVAEKFGEFHGDDAIDEFDEEQLSELAAASEQIRLRGDAPAIFEWFKSHDTTKHPEAAWLAVAVSLMEEAGVPIED